MQPSFTPASRTAHGGEPVQLTWQPPEGMVGLSFTNFFLRILTLGIYGFWGKTEVRRRIWSAVRLNGEPLQYTGTGMELFKGFLIIFAVLVVPIFLGTFVAVLTLGPIGGSIAQIVVTVLIFMLLGYAMYRATHYRMTRTSWRGIRGGLEGSAGAYAWTYIWTALLIPLTLGWISPWRTTKLQSMLVNDMRFGNRPLRFDAPAGPLYARFAGLWFGGIMLYAAAGAVIYFIMAPMMAAAERSGRQPTPSIEQTGVIIAVVFTALLLLAIIGAWYQAQMMNHYAKHTHFEGAKFKGSATAGGLIWLAISNFLITVLSFGILTPVAQARGARYQVDNLKIEGTVPLADIAQGAARQGSSGEGLAQAFDFDAV